MEQSRLHAFEAQCTQEEPPACQSMCPLHLDVRSLAKQMSAGKLGEARKTLDRHMPLPGLMAWLCDGPCMVHCRRAEVDEPVNMPLLERACAAQSRTVKPMALPKNGKSAAVLGAGFSGLALAYDDVEVPSLLPLYPYAVLASSFSKNLSIPGERVGYLALSPLMEGREHLMDALMLCNRVLGFVNPPVVGQHLMIAAMNQPVDAGIYKRRRNAMAEVLSDAGYDFLLPRGAFYFFPRVPGGDDVAFADKLMRERVLVVPGSGFYGPGHMRLAFCVDEAVIYRAADGLKKARG
jgi:hypothetical protein